MGNKKTKMIFAVVLLLAVGFAAVSTTLIINGTAIFGTNEDDFDVIFTKAIIDNVDVSSTAISEDGKTLTFETSELAIKDEESILDFTVKNNSSQYDANITMECVAEGENASEYYEITNTIPNIIEAKTSKEGTVTAKLKKSSVEEIHETFICTITATAVERDTIGIKNRNEIKVTAVDANNKVLNTKAYEITGDDKDYLLSSLIETGYVNSAVEVDLLIEVTSDDFDSIAITTFDVSNIASPGETIVILHYNEITREWEYIGTEIVNEQGNVVGNFTSYSPVAFVKINDDGTFTDIYKPKVISGDGTKVGNEICIDSECFYVINNDGTNITMLAKYNLNIGNYCTSSSSCVALTDTTGLQDANMIGIPSNQTYPRYGTTKFSSTGTIYSGSIVENYVNNYVTHLNSKYNLSATGTIITRGELVDLGCVQSTKTCLGSSYTWLYTSSYWTRTARDSIALWYVTSYGKMYDGGLFSDASFVGVRPVITISKSLLEN